MDDVRISRHVTVPGSELRFRFSRSGGPGGQNVNRRATRVELLFDVVNTPSLGPRRRARVLRKLASRIDADGILRIVVDEERYQARNRAVAVDRFRELLAQALRPEPPPRRPTKPGRTARERRLREKRERGQRKRERSWRPDE